MPYQNEHACRLKQPGGFQKDSFRRMERESGGKKYSVIMGRLKGEETMTEQAYRYNKETWSADAARSHCESHDGISFEAASGSEKSLTSLHEFSMYLTTSQDPKTGEKRWRAVASDTDKDFYDESMSIELYRDFIKRIESNEEVPFKFQSDFWKGGMPYLSISHYTDQNGDAVAGNTKAIYVDGKCLKAKGIFADNKIGNAAFDAIKKSTKEDSSDNRVRISIAFLDWKHSHGDYVFERKSETDICPICVELEENRGDKVYLNGQLVHFALTRVPVNARTDIDIDAESVMRSEAMTTKQEDAASIIGEELAEELDKREKSEMKHRSNAVVIKSDEEELTEESIVEALDLGNQKEHVIEPERTEGDKRTDAVREVTLVEMLEHIRDMLEKLVSKSEVKVEELIVEETKLEVQECQFDEAYRELRSQVEYIKALDVNADEKLREIQGHFEKFGQKLVDEIKSTEVQKEPDNIRTAVEQAIAPLLSRMSLLEQSVNEFRKVSPATDIPKKINIQIPPYPVQERGQAGKSSGSTIRNLARKTVGLND